MRINTDGCAALARAVDNAGVVELVEDDDVALADQRGDRPDVRGITAAKNDGRLFAFESCQLPRTYECDMWI